jgi:multiple sugar transport system permease protein
MRDGINANMLLPSIRGDRVFATCLLLPSVLFVLAFAVFPILNSLYLSLHRIVLGLPALEERFVGLENYVNLLSDPTVRHSTIISLLFVVISTSMEILLGMVMALILHQRFSARGLVRAAVLLPWAIPTVVSAQMWRFIFNDQYGLVNYLLFGAETNRYIPWLARPHLAFLAIIVADVWKTSSFAGLIILANLQMIPKGLYESARVDGAGPWQRFVNITLPLIRPGILIALLFRTMDAFRVFDLVFVMTQGGPAGATNLIQFYGYKKMFAEGFMGYGSSISVLVFLVVFALSLLYIRVLGGRLVRFR